MAEFVVPKSIPTPMPTKCSSLSSSFSICCCFSLLLLFAALFNIVLHLLFDIPCIGCRRCIVEKIADYQLVDDMFLLCSFMNIKYYWLPVVVSSLFTLLEGGSWKLEPQRLIIHQVTVLRRFVDGVDWAISLLMMRFKL